MFVDLDRPFQGSLVGIKKLIVGFGVEEPAIIAEKFSGFDHRKTGVIRVNVGDDFYLVVHALPS